MADLAGHAGGKGEVTAGVRCFELAAQAGDQGNEEQGNGLDAEGADALPEHLEAAQTVVRQGHDLLGLGEKGGAVAPQGDAPAAFLEEGGAQLLLQGGHGVAETGLGDIQALGGAAVMHLLGEDEEVAEMVDVHGERTPLFGLV